MVELLIHIPGQINGCRTVLTGESLSAREPDRVRAQQPPRPPRMAHAVEKRARSDLGREGEAPTDVTFSAAQHGGVHGQADGFEPRNGSPLKKTPDEAPIPPRVDLEPQPSSRPGNRRTLVNGPSPHGREGERDTCPPSGPYHGQFTGRIGDSGEAGGRQHQRKGQRLPEQRG